MDIYRGIGVNGESVSFVVGEVDLPIDTFTEALEKFSGTSVGEPAPGTIARKIATVNASLEISVLEDGEEITIQPEVEPKAVSEKVSLLNKSLIGEKVIGWGVLNKADEERGIATGIVIEAGWLDKKFDTDNESAPASVVEETAYDWLANSGAIDFMHSFEKINDEKVEVVESWVTRGPYKHGDYDVSVGTWMMSSRFDTSGKYWAGIKSGKLQAWSPGGLKRYVELEE